MIKNGITYLEPLAGSSEWYWGADYASGDLYEAEERFHSGHPIQKTGLFWSAAQRERSMSLFARKQGNTLAGRYITTDR